MTEWGENIPKDYGPQYSLLVRQILWRRGFKDNESLEKFLNPQLSDLVSPVGLLKDLDEAVSILMKARDRSEAVVVFGDYDVDGATSSSLLVSFLRELGWKVDFFVPHRIEEGYGISTKAVDRLLREKPRAKVVLSCDCGISSFAGIEKLKAKSLQVIVTDHHEVPTKRVPADAVLNPKQRDCNYPAKNLAGVGVAFLLCMGLRRALNERAFSLRPFLDLVALGTVCDLAELQGANRILVKAGLPVIEASKRPGIIALKQAAGVSKSVCRARDLGFSLGPRINAVGRMGDPSLGIRTLLSRDLNEAIPLALELESMNSQRRSLQKEQTDEALVAIHRMIENKPQIQSIVHGDDRFHLGLVGLIASRITEKYERPSCILTQVDDEHEKALYTTDPSLRIWKGSLRAPNGYQLAEALQSIHRDNPEMFLSFGGHSQAAGVALRESSLEEFKKLFENQIRTQDVDSSSIEYDAELQALDGIDELLGYFEPTGQANPSPRLMIRGFRIKQLRVMKEIHLKIFGEYLGRNWAILQFKSPWVKMLNQLPQEELRQISLNAVVELTENVWEGKKSLEFQLQELLGLNSSEKNYELHRRKNEIGQSPSARAT